MSNLLDQTITNCDYQDFKKAISASKLAPYEARSRGKEEKALIAYLMNCDLACAFWEPIHYCEIALRNTIARALVSKFTTSWFNNAAFRCTLSQQQIYTLDSEIQSLNSKKTWDSDDLIAKLPFKFWESLLHKKYLSTIWDNQPSKYFYFSQPISEIAILMQLTDWVSNTRRFRNRIAHQEEIFFKPHIGKVLTDALNTLACCSVSTYHIINKKQKVTYLLKQRKMFLNSLSQNK